jgi:hypothetical protein
MLFSAILLLVGCTSTQQSFEDSVTESVDFNPHIDIIDLPSEELSQAEVEALNEALQDEYKAEATYQKVVDNFGDVRPFTNIIRAEQTHSGALKTLYVKYGLTIPQNEWSDKIPDFISVADACEAGVEAEVTNVAIYDRLFSQVDNQDILQVFTALRDASQEKHLPAFQRCGGVR